MDNPEITCVELCAGYGGICLGLKRAIPTLRVVASCEIEAFAAANLVAKMEAGLLDSAPIWTNLKTFPFRAFRGRVHILVAGYPCQPFSAAGKRKGTDDPRHLWPFIADGIAAMQPEYCFFENVEGHISLGLREVFGELESLGYKATFGIFSASEVGAPHQRKRVFILAHRNDAGSQGRFGGIVPQRAGELPAGPGGPWPSRPGEPQHEWEPPRTVGGCTNSVAHAAGNGLIKQRPSARIEIQGNGTERSQQQAESEHAGIVSGRLEGLGGSLFRAFRTILRKGLSIERCPDEPGRFHVSGYDLCCDAQGVLGIAENELADSNSLDGSAPTEGREHDPEARHASEGVVNPQGQRPTARGAEHARQRGESAAAEPGALGNAAKRHERG